MNGQVSLANYVYCRITFTMNKAYLWNDDGDIPEVDTVLCSYEHLIGGIGEHCLEEKCTL